MAKQSSALAQIGSPARSEAREMPSVLSMGFRPFFLGAAAFASVSTLIWLAALLFDGDPSRGYVPPTWWHAHEMIFGFALAVVAGFLLTAIRNWTGRDTLHGSSLLALWSVWLLGRLAMSGVVPMPDLPRALVVLAFPLGLATAAAWFIVRARNWRNLGIVGVLVALTACSVAVHLEALGFTYGTALPGIYGAVHLLVLLNVIIGGRVIPMFTQNRTATPTRRVPSVDRVAIGAALGVFALGTVYASADAPRWVGLCLAGAAVFSGCMQWLRMRTWGFGAAMRVPMLAVLHLAYAWIGLGHLLLAAAILTPALSVSACLHALTVGVIGTMTLGMMARVGLGHTGRPIVASNAVKFAFVTLALAAVVRVSAAAAPPEWLLSAWVLSGILFALAFAIYALSAWNALTKRRPDGRWG